MAKANKISIELNQRLIERKVALKNELLGKRLFSYTPSTNEFDNKILGYLKVSIEQIVFDNKISIKKLDNFF